MIAGPFRSKAQRVAPDVSRTPKQEMTRRSWCNLVVSQFCFPLLTSASIANSYPTGKDLYERVHLLKRKLPQTGQVQPLPRGW
jgi:hypothetical protein